MESHEARVARGAAWLDENYPGWERRIDLSELNMHDCTACMIGQVVGPREWDRLYTESDRLYTESDASCHWLSTHGFVQHFTNPIDDPVRAAWVSLIKERFDSGLLSDLNG